MINGIKFACNSCIKGHRSSHCNHVERPLFEIRRKGRPVTQCAFCRDLRKTKQVHVKCVCSERKGKGIVKCKERQEHPGLISYGYSRATSFKGKQQQQQ
ncbi:copper fist DNA binding domain-domain-containing protein [Syncephalastrum racemosum]|uniref:Copper fist DNA binding domain-domain-containing protein n=1 Tax=Syncephalastrum racemosum TaxID=13706 RepID=A0A1X2HJH4_SYNRA|nr:copper fist DNA binding domain-domain-containing protein [Syncephalastrum racemosum]